MARGENGEYLRGYLPRLAPREGLRAGIDTSHYEFRPEGREPATMLFMGSFRHDPNRIALDWFVKQVLPLVLAARPDCEVMVVVGSDPPPAHAYEGFAGALEMVGYVDDILEPPGALCGVHLSHPERFRA